MLTGEEEWRPIKGYEGLYKVSKTGKVKSLSKTCYFNNRYSGERQKRTTKERILKQFNDTASYPRVCLINDKGRSQFSVHQLVAIAFLNHEIDGYVKVVDHIDNDKQNNNLVNLQVITQRENKHKNSHRKSKYRGVYLCKQTNKFRAELFYKGKRYRLGRHGTEIEASNAYNKKHNELLTQETKQGKKQ